MLVILSWNNNTTIQASVFPKLDSKHYQPTVITIQTVLPVCFPSLCIITMLEQTCCGLTTQLHANIQLSSLVPMVAFPVLYHPAYVIKTSSWTDAPACRCNRNMTESMIDVYCMYYQLIHGFFSWSLFVSECLKQEGARW